MLLLKVLLKVHSVGAVENSIRLHFEIAMAPQDGNARKKQHSTCRRQIDGWQLGGFGVCLLEGG